MSRDLAFVIAQLRHAYTHLIAERVVRQREFAEGLIGPCIERLEAIDAADNAPISADPDKDAKLKAIRRRKPAA